MKTILSIVIGLFALISICNSQTISLTPLGWSYGYVEVSSISPPLTVYATNLTDTGFVNLYLRYGALPTQSLYDEKAELINGNPLGNSVTYNSGIKPNVPYYFALYNESLIPQTVSVAINEGTMTMVPEPDDLLFLILFLIVIGAFSTNDKW
jgi:hypothetical protein